MNCAAVRDRLSEHALGVAGGRDAVSIDRHLAWCAACRKEARDLARAAAVLPYGLASAEPDPALEERIVEAVAGSAARAPRSAATRRTRLGTIAVLAAAMAVAGLGWGAVMAGRAARVEDDAAAAAQVQAETLLNFSEVLTTTEFGEADAFVGLLMPRNDDSQANGTAVTISAPQVDDQILVIVNGLPTSGPSLPYRVELRAGANESVVAGALRAADFDAGGVAQLGRELDDDLRRYGLVVVIDARGDVVLRGALEAQAPVPSPSP